MSKGCQKNLFFRVGPDLSSKVGGGSRASGKQGKIARVLMDRFLEMGFPTLYPVNPERERNYGVESLQNVRYPCSGGYGHHPYTHRCCFDGREGLREKKGENYCDYYFRVGGGGERGREIQQEMARIAREGGARIIWTQLCGYLLSFVEITFSMSGRQRSGTVGVV